MKFKYGIVMFLPFFIIFFFFLGPNAYGYLDPGTGSYILQLVIAGVASAVLALKIFWEKVFSFIKSVFGEKSRGNTKGGKK